MNDYDRIAKVIRHIDGAFMSQPDLEELAGVAGLSPAHFHRMFVKWAGVTPKDFVRSLTMDHAGRLLKGGAPVLDASLESGLSGPSRLHDLCLSVSAATPGEIKSGGNGMTITWGTAESPFGNMFLASTPRGISHLSFFDEDEAASLEDLRSDWPKADLERDDPAARETSLRIFQPATADSPLRLHLKGTGFQLKVWKALLEIPDGKLSTYGRLAKRIGKDGSARAVGNAVGSNRISYLVPCHRVIRETGALGGYRWDPLRKRAILAWENARQLTPP